MNFREELSCVGATLAALSKCVCFSQMKACRATAGGLVTEVLLKPCSNTASVGFHSRSICLTSVKRHLDEHTHGIKIDSELELSSQFQAN